MFLTRGILVGEFSPVSGKNPQKKRAVRPQQQRGLQCPLKMSLRESATEPLGTLARAVTDLKHADNPVFIDHAVKNDV